MDKCPICNTPCKSKEEVNNHIASCVGKLLSNSVNQSTKQQQSQQQPKHTCIVERLASGQATPTDQLLFTKLVHKSIIHIKRLNLVKKKYFASILSETRAELLDLHQKQKEFDKLLGLIIELDSDDDEQNSDNDNDDNDDNDNDDNDNHNDNKNIQVHPPTIEVKSEIKKQSNQSNDKQININITKNNEKVVVAEKNKGFTCTKCTKFFRYKGAYDKHLQSQSCTSSTIEPDIIKS